MKRLIAVCLLSILGLSGLMVLQTPDVASQPTMARDWFLTVIEPSGKQSTNKLAAPAVDPSTLSSGYVYKAPGYSSDDPTLWEVQSYFYAPASLFARQGERVSLRIFALNGDNHVTRILAPNGQEVQFDFWIAGENNARTDEGAGTTFNTQRGRVSVISFVASQVGTYTVLCGTHAPSMQAQMLVMP